VENDKDENQEQDRNEQRIKLSLLVRTERAIAPERVVHLIPFRCL
jgi:hypothetical protein